MGNKSTSEKVKRIFEDHEESEISPVKEVRKVAKVKKVAKTEEDEVPKGKKAKSNGKAEAKEAKGKESKKKGEAARGPQETPDGMVSVADLAHEAEITAQSARVKLRSAEGVERPEGRWLWKEGSKELKKAREALGL